MTCRDCGQTVIADGKGCMWCDDLYGFLGEKEELPTTMFGFGYGLCHRCKTTLSTICENCATEVEIPEKQAVEFLLRCTAGYYSSMQDALAALRKEGISFMRAKPVVPIEAA